MIIYNAKKEFVGIEKQDLEALGLLNLAELFEEASEFADLFVKTPGHIHNFKHVHWIDFIKSADSLDENRVIISVKGKNYKATLLLETLYLVDAPAAEAYGIVLRNLRELTKEEQDRISSDLSNRVVTPRKENTNLSLIPDEQFEEESITSSEPVQEPITLEEPSFNETAPIEPIEESITIEDIYATPQEEKIDLSFEEEPQIVSSEPTIEETPILIDEDDKFKDYHYDPKLASEELGLPVDLVEEFIQDFITQAQEFKPDIYEALQNGRTDSVRMISHKLKGVAANLRIEDAYEQLITINTSDNMDEVKRTLDRFYNYTLKKLAGEEVTPARQPIQEVEETLQENTQEQTESKPSDEEETIALQEQEVETDEEKIDLPIEEEMITIEDPYFEEETHHSQVKEEEEEEKLHNDFPQEEEKLSIDLEDDLFTQEHSEDTNKEDLPEEKEIEPIQTQETPLVDEPLPIDNSAQEPSEELLEIPFEEEEYLEETTEDEESDTQKNNEIQTSLSIDKAAAAQEMGIDLEIYEELLEDYKRDVSESVEELREFIATGKTEEAQKTLLRLKGMSENMQLHEIAKLFERLLTNGEGDEETLLHTIEQKLKSIK